MQKNGKRKRDWFAMLFITGFAVCAGLVSVGCVPTVGPTTDQDTLTTETPGDLDVNGGLEVDEETIFHGPVTFEDGFEVTGGEVVIDVPVEVNDTVTADDFVIDPTPDDDEPDPTGEILEITGDFELSGIIQAGKEVVLTIPTNGGDGSISFKFPEMGLSFTVFITDGEITFPLEPPGKFTIDSQGVVTIRYSLSLSGTGELQVWANGDRVGGQFMPITVAAKVVQQ